MTTPRTLNPVGAVTVGEFLRYLYAHRRQWPISKIARHARLPRSVVYRALEGENVTIKTLSRIARVLGAEVLVVINAGENRLRP